jgi:hypothetical protein
MDDISSIVSRRTRAVVVCSVTRHGARDDKGEERSRWQGWYCALCLSLRGRSVARDAAIHRGDADAGCDSFIENQWIATGFQPSR